MESDPHLRAGLLVEQLARAYRVGVKLATMFVSALSTSALAPGLTPWFPAVDGNALVIVDTNVAQAVEQLRGPGVGTYESCAHWIREHARAIDLRRYDLELPRFSPRLVQQALYAFCSKSNRLAQGTHCTLDARRCGACVPSLCPFVDVT